MRHSMRYGLLLLGLLLVSGLPNRLPAQVGYVWARALPGPGWYDFGLDAACDAAGNVLICGDFEGPTNIGGTVYAGLGSSDTYACRLRADGTYDWVNVEGSTSTDRNFSIFSGPDDHVYTCGYGKIPYPRPAERTAMHQWDAITTRIRPDGSVAWGRAMQGDIYSEGYDIVADAAGNSYTVGQLRTLGWYGTDTLHGHGSTDAFIVKFDSTGQFIWGKTFGGNLSDVANSVALDGQGNLWVGGSTTAIASFDSLTFVGGGGSDAYIAKLDPNGNILFVQSFSGPDDADVTELAVSADGDCYFVGNFTGTLTLPGQTLTAVDAVDFYYGKLTTNGNLQWVQQAGGLDLDLSQDLELDAEENIYIGGFFFGTLLWQSVSDSSWGYDDAFFAKIDSNGTVVLYESAHDLYSRDVFGIAVDAAQNVIVTGSFTDTMQLGNTVLISDASTTDVFVAKYATRSQSMSILNVIGTPYCANDQFMVPFQAWGNFDIGNAFLLELSDGNGSFAVPQVVGSLPGTLGDTIMATIPPGIVAGTHYRLRLRSTQPAAISPDNGYDLVLDPSTSIPVTILGDTVLCLGQPVTLSVDPRFITQLWSTGDTSSSIVVSVPGNVWVEATDSNGCTNRAAVEVVLCIGRAEPLAPKSIALAPNPAKWTSQVHFEAGLGGTYRICIFDAKGAICLQTQVLVPHSQAAIPLDLSELPSGIYQVQISNELVHCLLRLVKE